MKGRMTQMTSAAREAEDIARAMPREREGGASRSLATTKITPTTPAKPKTWRRRLNKKLGHHNEDHKDESASTGSLAATAPKITPTTPAKPKTSRKRLNKKLA
jgi:hypothetical protein